MTSSLTLIGPLLRKESSTTARLTGTPFALFTLLTLGLQAFQMILPLASFITGAILLGMDLFIPSSYKPGKKNSPNWFNSQCAKAVNDKNHYFKEWKRFQTQHSRTSFIQSRNTCYKTIKNAKSSFVQRINNKIAFCQAGSRSFWSMAKVVSQNFCQSSFPPLKNNSDSSSTTPSSKANIFASIFASNSNLGDQGVQPHHFPPSKFTMSPIKFSTRKVRQTLLQLDTSKSKGPDGSSQNLCS